MQQLKYVFKLCDPYSLLIILHIVNKNQENKLEQKQVGKCSHYARFLGRANSTGNHAIFILDCLYGRNTDKVSCNLCLPKISVYTDLEF